MTENQKKQFDIVIAVSNDLNSDQRMHRISNALHNASQKVCLVGNKRPMSKELSKHNYDLDLIKCFFQSGVLFYIELNLRLFYRLYRLKSDKYYAVDLDTILAVTLVSRILGVPFIYDAHEYFTEVPELIDSPIKKSFWHRIAKECIPQAEKCITVSSSLAEVLEFQYGVPFDVIFNYPVYKELVVKEKREKFIIMYQGKLNKGRGISQMIDAMKYIHNSELWLLGDGDLYEDHKKKIALLEYKDYIKLLGWIPPQSLHKLTCQADLGVNLLVGNSLNYYYSAANKFYDYVMAEVPILTMPYPEYTSLNETFDIAYFAEDLSINALSSTINEIINDRDTYKRKKSNCKKTKMELRAINSDIVKSIIS